MARGTAGIGVGLAVLALAAVALTDGTGRLGSTPAARGTAAPGNGHIEGRLDRRPSNARTPRPGPDADEIPCGGGRWPVKTLSDTRSRRIPARRHDSSVSALRRVRAVPVRFRTPRRHRFEGRIFRVRVRLRGFSREVDHDIHLVVGDPRRPGRTLIAELPDPRCRAVRRSRFFGGMHQARVALRRACGRPGRRYGRLRGHAVLTGVGFFDNPHEQTGGAPNGVELHPIIRVADLRCRRIASRPPRSRHRR